MGNEAIAEVGSATPCLSIIVAAYNVGEFISQCLQSILDAPSAISYEVVVVNDSSTDGTLGIANGFASGHPAIFRVIDKPHGGLGDTWNVGLDCARGDWVTFVDGDDMVLPSYFASIERALARGRFDVIHFCARQLNPDGSVVRSTPMSDDYRNEVGDPVAACVDPNSPYQGFTWRRVIRRSLMLPESGDSVRFDVGGSTVFDLKAMALVAERAESVWYSSDETVVYRIRFSGNELSRPDANIAELEARIMIAHHIEEACGEEPSRYAWLSCRLKVAGLVRRFYAFGDAEGLRRVRRLRKEIKSVSSRCLSLSRRLQLAAAEMVLAAHVPCALVPKSVIKRMSSDNPRLLAQISEK